MKDAVKRTWEPNSLEATKREQAMVRHFILKGQPTRLADDPSFKDFCRSLDPNFNVPGKVACR
jgi:hypothetical protein